MNARNIVPLFLIATSLAATGASAHESTEHRLESIAAAFADGAIVGDPSIVDCKLSDGTETSCFAITVTGEPESHMSGPWCPTNIADEGPEAGGIWLENDQVYEVDGPFIEKLAEFYGDEGFQLFNPETGEIRVTDTLEGCAAAARPNVDPDWNKYCVECQISYMEGPSTKTYVIPVEPVTAKNPVPVSDVSGIGIAFSGAHMDGPAPRGAILAAHTLAPFDDCGGHVNLHVGYHYHAITDCATGAPASVKGHADAIGVAIDGHLIYARLDADGTEPSDLDACRGHTTEGLGYHYHANDPGANAIIPCHTAATGCVLVGEDTDCDASIITHRPPPRGRND